MMGFPENMKLAEDLNGGMSAAANQIKGEVVSTNTQLNAMNASINEVKAHMSQISEQMLVASGGIEGLASQVARISDIAEGIYGEPLLCKKYQDSSNPIKLLSESISFKDSSSASHGAGTFFAEYDGNVSVRFSVSRSSTSDHGGNDAGILVKCEGNSILSQRFTLDTSEQALAYTFYAERGKTYTVYVSNGTYTNNFTIFFKNIRICGNIVDIDAPGLVRMLTPSNDDIFLVLSADKATSSAKDVTAITFNYSGFIRVRATSLAGTVSVGSFALFNASDNPNRTDYMDIPVSAGVSVKVSLSSSSSFGSLSFSAKFSNVPTSAELFSRSS